MKVLGAVAKFAAATASAGALWLVTVVPVFAAPAFPPDVFTLDIIADKIRSPLSEKIADMRTTYRLRETPQGKDATKIEFLDSTERAVAALFFERSLTADRKEMMEEVRLMNPEGTTLVSETLLTSGSELKYSEATQRIFLESNTTGYALKPNETSKTAVIILDGAEIFRFKTVRNAPDAATKLQFTDIFFGGAKFMTISDSLSRDGTFRSLKYNIVGDAFSLQALGWTCERTIPAGFSLEVTASRPAGYLADNHRFYSNDVEVFGLNAFLKTFSSTFFDPYIDQAATKFLSMVAQTQYPTTEKRAALGPNKFLDDLIYLRTLLLQANDPVTLSRIKIMVNGFIDSIQKGTLIVNDQRPSQ